MRKDDVLKAGELNLLISLYAPTVTVDEITGESLIAAQIPASKRSITGGTREVDTAGREVAAQFAVFTIRFRAGVDTAKFLTFAGDRWDIDAVDDVNGAHRKLDITARKVR